MEEEEVGLGVGTEAGVGVGGQGLPAFGGLALLRKKCHGILATF